MVAWFTEPAGVFVQLVEPIRVGVPLAEWIVGPLRAELMARFPGRRDLLIVIDATLMTGRDPAVRRLLQDAAREMQPVVSRAVLIPPAQASSVYLTTLDVASSLLRLFGFRLEIARSASFVQSSFTLRVAERRQ
jgi:hypothetical protein